MSKNIEILKARSYYYEFLAMPFFFYETAEKFNLWLKQLDELAQNPLNDESADAFTKLREFDFETFKSEQNSVLFDLSYINVPLGISFYEEGRDDGAARLRTIEILKRSGYRRDVIKCKSSEDFVGFVFLLMATFLRDEANEVSEDQNFSSELFESLINGFVDEFIDMLYEHEKAEFFRTLTTIMRGFFSLERSFLALEAPLRDRSVQSVAEIALNRQPYQTKMPTAKSKIHWDEFTAL
ncbi:MAG: formate dehydrogenase-specific chaperone [Campylobacter sp.]|nr:formate dehydrogenase-specific chaperone [Campylobacter sp.]